jgi:DNA-binding XRE family transcriptional regulator
MNERLDSDRNFPAWLTLSWAWEQAMDDPEAVKAAIARNLCRLREARGLTQKSLAEQSQASLGSLKAIESAKTLPDIALILDLARILEVPVAALVDSACAVNASPKDVSRPLRPRLDMTSPRRA